MYGMGGQFREKRVKIRANESKKETHGGRGGRTPGGDCGGRAE
jgi:hypothetical protein